MHERCYLLKAEGGVASGNALALSMSEWIEHRVVRMNARQSVLVQLILHYVNQLLHPTVILRPVTDYLPATRHTTQQ